MSSMGAPQIGNSTAQAGPFADLSSRFGLRSERPCERRDSSTQAMTPGWQDRAPVGNLAIFWVVKPQVSVLRKSAALSPAPSQGASATLRGRVGGFGSDCGRIGVSGRAPEGECAWGRAPQPQGVTPYPAPPDRSVMRVTGGVQVLDVSVTDGIGYRHPKVRCSGRQESRHRQRRVERHENPKALITSHAEVEQETALQTPFNDASDGPSVSGSVRRGLF